MPWDYTDKEAEPYGAEDTYEVGMFLLADDPAIEDWGCGFAWAKRFRYGDYVGVDFTPGFADVQADLTGYRSDVAGIFMRHVLEHSDHWATILDNALASTRHLVLVIFTPFSNRTHYLANGDDHIDIGFAASDIEGRFGDRPFTYEDYVTATQYGVERVYDVRT